MTTPVGPYKAAAVQAEPVWGDLLQAVGKTLDLIDEAANQGVSLIAFPELWIPGYPLWLFMGHPMGGLPQFAPPYIANSLPVGGAEYQRLAQAAVDKGVTVVMGASLLEHGRVFMGQCLFGADGTVVTRYKLEPTSVEKTLFKQGDGSGVKVYDLPGIGRLGFLQCFEHLQAENRLRLQEQHEQVHVAAWPVLAGESPETYALSAEANLAVSQAYAVESGAYVLAPMAMIGEAEVARLAGDDATRRQILQGAGRGLAQVFAPNGMPIGATLKQDEEGLVVSGIDLSLIAGAKLFYDPMGTQTSREIRRAVTGMSGDRTEA